MENAKPNTTIQVTNNAAEIRFGQSLKLQGITAVIETDDKTMHVNMGANALTVHGQNLKLEALDLQAQTAYVVGSVHALVYGKGQEKGSFWHKLFR